MGLNQNHGNLSFTNAGTPTTALPSSGTIVSQIIPVWNAIGYCINLFWTGTPVGNFTISGSCDLGQSLANGTVNGVTNWVTVAGSTVAAGGGAGNEMINLDAQYYRWFQVVYTATSGTGTVTVAQYNVKGP